MDYANPSITREELEIRNERLADRCDVLEGRVQEFCRAVTFWQGKHAIVCRENNALRRKLRKGGGDGQA